MKYSPLMCLVLLCLLCTNCKKNISIIEPPIDPKTTAFTQQLTDLYDASELPGFAVTVIKEGAINYQQAFGLANVEKGIDYTNQTTQPIGSISKTFIGVALMKAIEQGHFTLETAINDILPFDMANPYNTAPITIKHLVTHTAGLEDSDETYELQYYIKEGENMLLPSAQVILDFGVVVGKGHALGDYLQAVYSETGPLFDEDTFLEEGPGKTYEYSNIGASLAAYLIEVKTGMSYADFVKQNIFDPLNMTNTGYDRNQSNQDKLASLYIGKAYPLPEYGHSSYPDGFVNTSNEMLSKYLLEMMKGAAGNGTLLSKESYQTLFQRQSPEGMEAGEIHGVFWDLTDAGRIEHNGADPGVIAFLSFDPATNTAHQVMANINEGGIGEPLGVDGQISFGQFFEILNAVRTFEKE